MKRRLIFPGDDGFGDHLQELALSRLPKGQTVPAYMAKEFSNALFDATMDQFKEIADNLVAAMAQNKLSVDGPEPAWSRQARKDMGHIWIVAWLAIWAKYRDCSVGN